MTAPLVLLDLDGTLIDSSTGILSSLRHAYRVLGLPLPGPEAQRSFIGPPLAVSLARHGVPGDLIPAGVTAYREAFAGGGLDEYELYPGVLEALGELRSDGYRLAIATAKAQVFADPVCERSGIATLVDGVFGASLDGSRATKDAVVAWALATLDPDRAAAALMVGDREHDVLGAAVHDVPCLGVGWGFAAPGELERAGAVGVAATTDRLAAAVRDLLPR